jgi:hypothetical protein
VESQLFSSVHSPCPAQFFAKHVAATLVAADLHVAKPVGSTQPSLVRVIASEEVERLRKRRMEMGSLRRSCAILGAGRDMCGWD